MTAPAEGDTDVLVIGGGLAARAGAELRDMEFIRFYPWRCIDPFDKARVSIQPSTFVLGARLYNSAGERFMQVFNREGAEASTRDIGARGIFEQIRKGLGIRGGVRLDLSGVSPADFERSNPKVARFLCETAELSLTSALFREESRGAHYREDFPDTCDERWRGSVTMRRAPAGYAVALTEAARIGHAA